MRNGLAQDILLEKRQDPIDLRQVIQAQTRHEEAALRNSFHKPFASKRLERFADGHAAKPQRLSQCHLTDGFSRSQLSGQNAPADFLGRSLLESARMLKSAGAGGDPETAPRRI